MTEGAVFARCPAKVNLCLRVLSRRDDGYHELDTVFQAIDLWDTIEVGPGQGLSLACDFPGVPTDRSNLVLRAAARLGERRTGRTLGASILLRKSIPPRGGLGGGSSDAAGALLLLDRFWNLQTGTERLTSLARDLGADVPFFLKGGTARGTGRGDRIEPLPYIGEIPVLLAFPPFGLSTSEVFGRLARKLTPPRKAVSLPILSRHKWPEGNDFGFMVNDLEPVVFEGWPELRAFRDALLDARARVALLSGSGSTVYGLFPAGGEADEAAGILRERFPNWTILLTRTTEGAAQVVERVDGGGCKPGRGV